jgi:hypothetical protein
MAHATASPRRVEALSAFGLRNALELCKALGITAFGTRNPMLDDKRSAAYESMSMAARERIAGLPIVPAGRQAGDSLHLRSKVQSAQERGCRLGVSDRSDERRIGRCIVSLAYRANI